MNKTGWTFYCANGPKKKVVEVENNRPKAEEAARSIVREGYTITDIKWFGKAASTKTACDILGVAYRGAFFSN